MARRSLVNRIVADMEAGGRTVAGVFGVLLSVRGSDELDLWHENNRLMAGYSGPIRDCVARGDIDSALGRELSADDSDVIVLAALTRAGGDLGLQWYRDRVLDHLYA